ncbi:CHAT domain-containing protein [Sphingopyxis sp.]|uniref:CHAT domain-containing protein n=1 Tax=Sphingopyxis sp. TaxID=1908224 RepID=UPI002FC8F6EE
MSMFRWWLLALSVPGMACSSAEAQIEPPALVAIDAPKIPDTPAARVKLVDELIARSEPLFFSHRLPLLRQALAIAMFDGPSPTSLDIRARIIELTSLDIANRHGLRLEGEPGWRGSKRGSSVRGKTKRDARSPLDADEEAVIAEVRRTLDDHQSIDWRADPITARAVTRLAQILIDVGDDTDARIVLKRAVAQRRTLAGHAPSAEYGEVLRMLAAFQLDGMAEERAAAEGNLLAAIAQFGGLSRPDTRAVQELEVRLAQIYEEQDDRRADARVLRNRLLGEARATGSPREIATALAGLAKVETLDQKPEAAIPLLVEAIAMAKPVDDAAAMKQVEVRQQLADIYYQQTRPADEREQFRAVVTLLRERFPKRLDWTRPASTLVALDRQLDDDAAVIDDARLLLAALPAGATPIRLHAIASLSSSLLNLEDYSAVVAATDEVASTDKVSGQPSRLHLASSLLDRAVAMRELDQFDSADPLYRQIFAIRHDDLLQWGISESLIYSKWGENSLYAGNDGAARSYFDKGQAASAAEAGPASIEHARYLRDLADVITASPRRSEQNDNLREAERLSRKAMSIVNVSPDATGQDRLDTVSALVDVLAAQSRLPEAIAQFEKLIKRERRFGRAGKQVLRVQNAYANFLANHVGSAAARSVHRAMFETALAAYGAENETSITIGLNSMAVDIDLGQLEHNHFVYGALFGDGKNAAKVERSLALVMLAQTEASAGNAEQAQILLRQADAAALASFDPGLGVIVQDGIDGLIGTRRGDDAMQLPLLKSLVSKCGTGQSPECADFRADYGRLLNRTGEAAEALPYVEAGLALAEAEQAKLTGRDFRSRRRVSDRIAAEQFERYGAFLDTLWSAQPVAESETARPVDPRVFRVAQRITNSEGAIAMALAQTRIAAGKGELATLMRRRQEIADLLNRDDESQLAVRLRNVASLLGTAKEAFMAPRQDKKLDRRAAGRLAVEYAELDRRIREGFPEYGALLAPVPVALNDVQSALEPNEAVLIVGQGDTHLHAILVTQKTSDWRRSTTRMDEIADLVATLLCHADIKKCPGSAVRRIFGSAAAADYTPFDTAAAYRYYSQTFGLFEPQLAGIDTIFFVGEGDLAQVPPAMLVAALPNDQETRWLADRFGLIRLPSVSALLLKDGESKARWSREFEAYGDPVLDGPPPRGDHVFIPDRGADGIQLADVRFLRRLKPLSGTRRELETVSRLFPSEASLLHVGPDATEVHARANEGLANARIISFATHGLLPTEVKGVDEPGLVLTPPANASASDDGLLTASEVTQMLLTADIVILSACNTASAERDRSADSMSSLARAFLFAGADSILASHWRVSDEATVILITEMLRLRRGDAEISRAKALQQAMKAVRTGLREDGSRIVGWRDYWAHPSAWASFALIANQDR